MTTKGTTRHFNYAWIEFGHSGDGQAFAAGMAALGWKNLFSQLPRKTDATGSRYVDSAHPLLPIRWKGAGLLALPNSVVDTEKVYPRPWVNDTIFNDFRGSHTDDEFKTAIREVCKFLAQWLFAPGLKKNSDTESELAMADATDWADFAIASGHGYSGKVYGGDSDLGMLVTKYILELGAPPGNERLKYIMIPTCYNLASYNCDMWIPALRRDPPVHGILGYSDSYPGGEPGRTMQQKFTASLKANYGKTPILQAFRDCHAGYFKNRWGAILHAESAKDTMKDWLAGTLVKPDPEGELRHYTEDNWPDGVAYTEKTPDKTVYFFVNGTKVDRNNNSDTNVGLFPGEQGHLELSGTLTAGETYEIGFYFYRPTHDDMDLEKLLTIGTATDATVTMLADYNKRDKTTFKDALRVEITRSTSKVQIPFTVNSDAHTKYPADGLDSHGRFSVDLFMRSGMQSFYPDGIMLRKPRA